MQMVNQNIYSSLFFNYFDAINKPNIDKTISVFDWLTLIKTGGEFINLITEARVAGKYSNEYKKIKQTQLPAISPNFLFKDSRRNSNIIESTGLVYLDFDVNSKEKAIELKEHLTTIEYVYGSFLSLSELGCGCYIRVSNVTMNTVKEIAEEFAILFNLDIDKKAILPTQVNVLTYDPNVYINENATVYTSNIEETEIDEIKIEISTEEFNSLIFESKLTDYPSECVYFPDGRPFVRCFVPFHMADGSTKKISNGNRNYVISSYIHNLVWLNPNANEDLILKWCNTLNKTICNIPLTNDDCLKIVKQKFNLKIKEQLKPMGVKLKKYWIDPNSKDKRKAFLSSLSILKKESTLDKINQFFGDELYNRKEKATLHTISEYTKLCYSTIKSNITAEHKRLLKNFNEEIKNKTKKG